MNTEWKPTTYIQCERCDWVFMKVGSTPIGLSRPHKPSTELVMVRGEVVLKPITGICPRHQRSLIKEER